MSEFAGNVMGTNENPVVSASRGRFFVPVGDDSSSSITKRIVVSVVFAVAFVAVVLFSSYFSKDRESLPQFDQIRESIGCVVQDEPKISSTAKYADVEFDLNVHTFDGLICGATYTGKTDADGVFSVAGNLIRRYGEPGQFDDVALSVMTEEVLDKTDSATWTWDLSERHNFNGQALEELDCWPGKVAGYVLHPAKLYMDFAVLKDGKEYAVTLRLEVRPDGMDSIETIVENQ